MEKTKNIEIIGKIAWLWACSPLHKNWSTSLLMSNTLPAIKHEQYILIERDNFPVAFCSWANLNLEKEIEYLNNVTSLQLDDWNTGDRKWIIDWIAPFGDNQTLYKKMRDKFPYGLFRAIRIDTFNHTGKITEFHGGKIDKRLAKDMFTKYQRDFIEKIKT
ncbi:toxin-activating lysine-acyltransferase, partial [Escherichia coli]|nr:toxin-activating lysine-acyltransferase [Escherichia coli]